MNDALFALPELEARVTSWIVTQKTGVAITPRVRIARLLLLQASASFCVARGPLAPDRHDLKLDLLYLSRCIAVHYPRGKLASRAPEI